MQQRPYYVCDTECYFNYWSIGFTYALDRSIRFKFEMFPGQALDIQGIVNILSQVTIVTFNGGNYDDPMITLAICGADNATLKKANDLIIGGRMKPWDFYKYFRIERPAFMDSIDLIEPAPGVGVSLKIYSGRLNSDKMQDLPIEPHHHITPEMRDIMRPYQQNDENNTLDLFENIRDRIDLRISMSERYGVDLRSKSDAQIAEAVIRHDLGFFIEKPFWPHHTEFKVRPIPFISFSTPQLQEVHRIVMNAPFLTSDKDQVLEEEDENGNKIKTGIIIPKAVKDIRIRIGSTSYKLGYGGLHSQEKGVHHVADGFTLADRDVTSYYPFIIINQRLYPKQMGEPFVAVYTAVVNERVDAKQRWKYYKKMRDACTDEAEAANWEYWRHHYKTIEEALKIVINGSFGKFGSKYSILFSPDLMIQTTMTGQLSLLMLIERLEESGIPVVSANTDGVVIKCPNGLEWLRDEIIHQWEKETDFNTEETLYSAIYSRDVNNYIAVTTSGEVKRKGIFAEPGIRKNPNNTVCVNAVIDYLTKQVPIADTVYGCTDIRNFLTIRGVKGGGEKNGVFLGKAVRWYYGQNETGVITYKTNGNRVPRSEGAVPLMELPKAMPPDVDFNWYIKEAHAMLAEMGITGG